MIQIKSRFSPSPTGLMHLGNVRTALFNVLFAKSRTTQEHPAIFLLRIEDTDLARSEKIFIEKLMQDLKWLGLEWQEGPHQHLGHEPYFQSERREIYEQYYQKLLAAQQAYWCFCTETELTIARRNQLNAGIPPRYAGTCRHLTQSEIEAKKAKGLTAALRFKIPDKEIVQFNDFIQGPKIFSADDIGDFIILKTDGSASFMFCNAVDDALMGVTHVMRGEDHLTNTPRQLLVLKALGLPCAQYGHMPLITGFDGKPLSKRNGSEAVETLRERGYHPIAIVNYLSRLGHHFTNPKLLSLDELGRNFSEENIGRSPARFDMGQLNFWQKEAVMSLSKDVLWDWMEPSIQSLVPQEKIVLFIETIKQNVILPQDAKEWAERLLSESYTESETYWQEEAITFIQNSNVNFLIEALEQAILHEGDQYPNVINSVMKQSNAKGKALFMPVRAAITGKCDGPELAKIFTLMGKDLLLARVKNAKKLLR